MCSSYVGVFPLMSFIELCRALQVIAHTTCPRYWQFLISTDFNKYGSGFALFVTSLFDMPFNRPI